MKNHLHYSDKLNYLFDSHILHDWYISYFWDDSRPSEETLNL